jgi:hypothetical protein
VIGGRNGQEVRDRATVTTTRLAETEGATGPRAVGVTGAEPPVKASYAPSARDLERHQHAFADAPLADLISDCDYVGHRLMPDGKGPREEPERRHRLVEVAPRDSERTHERTSRVREVRIRDFLPVNPSGFEECELAHRQPPYRRGTCDEREPAASATPSELNNGTAENLSLLQRSYGLVDLLERIPVGYELP